MEAAARADGVALLINSGFRSDAEQAILFARHPDPKWVARPGTSLHRNGTELDLGPPAAYGWLDANASRFHFTQRYSWEPWHYGFMLNAGSSPRAAAAREDGDSANGSSGLPSFVPAAYAPAIARAAQRWNVSGALLAAQLYAESNFNPFAVSPAGAQGIAQFMPGTARAMGLANPFDAAQAIDAQAHLMRDHLRQFGSVPLALAAYNAGPGAVSRCGCVPPFAETRAYVAKILGLMNGAGEPLRRRRRQCPRGPARGVRRALGCRDSRRPIYNGSCRCCSFSGVAGADRRDVDADFVDVRQAAALIGRHPETIRRWVWSGRIAARRRGNRLLRRPGGRRGRGGGAEPRIEQPHGVGSARKGAPRGRRWTRGGGQCRGSRPR